MKRWIIRILVLLVILIIAALVTAYFVLKSDLPRRVLVDALRDQTGLSVEASSLSISWSGRTVLEDLQVGLPLEEDPFVTVRRVRVQHHSLVKLAITRSLGLKELRLVDPVISLEAQPGEQWNLIQAAQTISLTRGKKEPDTGRGGVPDLPRLRIERAVVDVRLPDGREFSYAPLAIEGDPDGPLAWDFALSLQDRVALSGRVAPGGAWAHRLDFTVEEVRSLIEPFVATLPEPLDAAGAWRGSIRSGALVGALSIQTIHAGQFTAAGAIGAELVGTNLRAPPTDLVLARVLDESDGVEATSAGAIPDRLFISGGSINANLQTIRADAIVGRVDGYADFHLDGNWSLADTAGSADIAWQGIATRLLPEPVEHRGDLHADFAITPLGVIDLFVDVSTSGFAPQGTWDIAGIIVASGDSFDDLRVAANMNRASFVTPQFEANLAGLNAEVAAMWPIISDARITIPDARAERAPLVLTGRTDTETLEWSIVADAEDYLPPITMSSLPELPPLSVALRATGDTDQATLESLLARAEGVRIRSEGVFTLVDRSMTLSLSAERGAFGASDSIATEAVSLGADIEGTLSPLDLQITGTLSVVEPSYQSRVLQSINAPFIASATAETLALSVDPFEIVDGSVSARATYSMGDAEARVMLTSENISLERISEIIGVSATVTGMVGADLAAAIPINDPAQTVASGTWVASGINLANLANIDGEGTLTAGNGALRLPQLTLRNDEGVLRGNAAMDLDRPDRFHAVFSLEDWPLELEGPSLVVTASGDADLFVDLVPLGATGNANLSADLRYRDQPAATLVIESSITGRDLTIDALTAEALGGSARGAGTLPLSSEFWERTRFELEWSGVHFAEARQLIPLLEPLRGSTVGSLDIRPAEDPRAQLPLQLTLEADFTDARFADFTVGGGQRDEADLVGLLHFGPGRAEIQRGSLVAADGTLDLYGRVSDQGGELAMFGNLAMNSLDLQQIASAASLDDRPMPGRVSGEWALGGSFNEPHRLFGSAAVSLTESDLLALPGIAQVYGALKLDIGSPKPEGQGKALLRIEGKALEITRLVYFNRGTDVVAGLRIDDIFNPAQSPIEGAAVGSIRPLRAGPQSFLSTIDRLLRAAQANAVAVEISGTIAEPKTKLVPLKDLTSALRRLLRGSVD